MVPPARGGAVPLDDEQRRFVDAPLDASYALAAGAGSGKTHTMVARIRRLVSEERAVLVFSHANKTVDELRERLEDQGVAKGAVDVVTMHSYCISRLCRAGRARVHDFDELIEQAANAFEAAELECFHSHVIVDEANDLSTDQNRIVRALFRRGHHVVMTGDLMQSIYGFQGSSPTHFRAFAELLPESRRLQLGTNYRSRNSHIVTFANALAADDIREGVAVQMRLRPDAAPGARPELVAVRDNDELGQLVLQRVRLLHQAHPGETVMVLAHDNDRLGAVFTHLMARGVQAALHSSQRSQEFRRLPERARTGGVVQLLTIHGAKGGEADHVVLLTAHDRGDSCELAEDAGGSESRRMLYVACTRAKRTLQLCFVRDRRDGPHGERAQPCRWLNAAWALLDRAPDVHPYASPRARRDRQASQQVNVTDLFRNCGAVGFHDYYERRRAARLEAAAAPHPLHADEVVDLEDGEGLGEPIAAQAAPAYQFGLELFMGKLFELHAALVFDAAGTRSAARALVRQVCRLVVNQEVMQFAQSPEGRLWWDASGHEVLRLLLAIVQEADDQDEAGRRDDGVLAAQVLEGLPRVDMRRPVWSALNSWSFKFTGYEALGEAFRDFLNCELVQAPLLPRPAPFETFFRAWHKYWDDALPLARSTHQEAFRAAGRIAEGGESGRDLCLLAALQCCWEPQLRPHRPDPAAWQALLHLSQPRGSLVRISPERLMLSERATEQLRHDARRILDLLGPSRGMQAPNAVPFRCRLHYGDMTLAAAGVVVGRADVSFDGGSLEIKAVKRQIEPEHAGQAIWYACAAGEGRAWLWDIYRRSLLVWHTPDEPQEFQQSCLNAYLRHNAPPGGQERVWPQRISLEAPAAAGARYDGA
jgi:hypothetical protein